ncbi:MAG: PEP-CTERM sorting domain-containing protein [Planctomycetota bacterium]
MLSSKLLAAATVLTAASVAHAVVPYKPAPVTGTPVVGSGMSSPDEVFGKEYSHDFDFSTLGPFADPEQVIAWDGKGGTADSVDYTGTRMFFEEDFEVDAIANTRDALFDQVRREEAHLTFSHDDMVFGYDFSMGFPAITPIPVPSGGPVFLSNGNMIGGAGEVSVEEAVAFGAPPASQFAWASLSEVNAMPEPVDVDGLEVWGPEPREGEGERGVVVGDADKYSLDVDFPSGASVWNASGTPYIGHPMIVSAVESLLGPIPPTAFDPRSQHQGRQAINLDALMVSDIIGDKDTFDFDPIGEPNFEELLDQNGDPIEPFGIDGEMRGDAIVFSIRQILNPEFESDLDGYYATGSELFVLDSLTGASYLMHGGHEWSHDYSLSELMLAFEDGPQEFEAVIDINAIEAIGEGVVSLPTPNPGDFNGDGIVDAADYTVWRDSLGTGDSLLGNGDETGASAGVVDVADFLLWKSFYGTSYAPAMAPLGSGGVANVPEPATALSVLLAGVVAAVVRRRD